MRLTLQEAKEMLEVGQTVKAKKDCTLYDIGKAAHILMNDFAWKNQSDAEKKIKYVIYEYDEVTSYLL